MSEREIDLEDLVARARRGLLSRAEEERLAQALAENAELAAAYRVGVELDRAGAVQGGDDALIARAADAAMARAAEMTSRTAAAAVSNATRAKERGATRFVAIAAAVLLTVISASGIAAALVTGALPWPFKTEEKSEPAKAEEAPSVRKKVARKKVVEPAPQEAPVVEAPIEAVPEEPAAPQRARKPVPEASAMFSVANAARRSGELNRARRLYAALIEQHPGSDEAGLARVSLGKLLLASGDARGAEREFRNYLAAGGGQLEEEALVGQAQSFGRLGRSEQEQKAWERLLAAHPKSVYAAQAQQRLRDLSP